MADPNTAPQKQPRLTRRAALSLGAGAAVAGVGLWWWQRDALPNSAEIDAAYGTPMTPPAGPLNVFHLGHSLVGRDMPAMLAQLAGPDHQYGSQLGWGTSLRQHWYPDVVVEGFATENAHDRFRPARAAVASGDYGALVLTEMIELADALRYHDSAIYLARWADLARDANPACRVYLYETWHGLDDPEGFLTRLDRDLPRYWEGRLLAADLARAPRRPIHVIPAGQVMARLVRRIEAGGQTESLRSREDLFALAEDGTRDPIHLSDIGAYMVALTHYAVLYHRAPLGLPRHLLRADGSRANPPCAEAARLMQQVVWEVVRAYPKTGVTA